MKREIKAEIIAGSLNEHGQKITTWVLTYPRIIHAEMMTHRVFSRNAASSRAIPALKMIKDVESDPFIPVAWQKEHKGMQGTEYWEGKEVLSDIEAEWTYARDSACSQARILGPMMGVTKQLTNRLLEPFQWYTCICTATEYDNFFELRCPQYDTLNGTFRSRKDAIGDGSDVFDHDELLDWLRINKGQGEIHISLLAEAMWDARNQSEPKQLKAGEWHIPFGDRFDEERIIEACIAAGPKSCGYISQSSTENAVTIKKAKIKIATARCARVSYNNFEGKDDYEADIKLYDRLLESGHFSPMEHCAMSAEDDKFYNNFKGFKQLRYLEQNP